ncbi:uncharacterized protein [Apostichopus japonicus]|uniref:uncharacterized protein isoform X1 n=2 Tax=Stichopus japonicus TaxID=307972 RepID=UPI003AB1697C
MDKCPGNHFCQTFYPKVCCKSRGLRMSWKAAVGVLCTVTIILGTYLKYFDHPPAEETLDANRNMDTIERPSFFKSARDKPDRGGLREDPVNHSSNLTRFEDEKTFNGSTILGKETEVDQNNSVLNDTEKDVPKSTSEKHGIKKFDWDGWIKENEFVNIGNTWAYCDDEDPILVGKIILFNNDGSLTMSLVMNTTFEADITFGTVEVKVLYYETVFFHKTFDICEMAEKFEDEFFICPMAKGEKYYFREQPLSSLMPSGEFSIDILMKDEYEKTILCGACKFVI